jgi:hypothetical protein
MTSIITVRARISLLFNRMTSCLRQREEHRNRLRRFPLPQRGDEKHHRDDRQVLEDQDPDGGPPVTRVDFHPVGQHLQDDGRAREGDDEPDEQSYRNG